ncbi:MAG: DUF86 domain-containing protein [Bacteroidales bacterium]|nr:DUF86 domain-containing protein [Bacteroidales bacterium]
MDRTLRKYLTDISASIAEIESFLNQRPKMFETFCNDSMFRRAIERNLEIIGEAMNQVLKINSDISITSVRKIVDTRNFIIHAYDSLRPEILWMIVIKYLPVLKQEVNTLLADSAL